jgi:6,7-dimethyl-8-ribityllumazine synthase
MPRPICRCSSSEFAFGHPRSPALASPNTAVYTQIERRCIYNLRLDSQNNDRPGALSGQDFRFAIVASRWNDAIVSRLIDGAVEALKEAAVPDQAIDIYRVPGSFELPLCALKAAETKKFDAVICLGVIIRGETPHFDFIAREAARGISDAGLKTGVPLLFGVITAENVDQARARAGARQDNKGYEAALAALEVVNLYRHAFGSN